MLMRVDPNNRYCSRSVGPSKGHSTPALTFFDTWAVRMKSVAAQRNGRSDKHEYAEAQPLRDRLAGMSQVALSFF